MNPLLTLNYNTPHNTFPFAAITPEGIEEAIHEGIRLENAEIEAITSQDEPPTFANTIVALAKTGEILERATTVMYNLLSANTCDELEALAERMSPILSEHSSNIMLNEALYARVKSVKDAAPVLDEEDQMLLDKTYDGFEKSGATLSQEKKARFREIKAELSRLTLQFSQNNIKETNDFVLHVIDEAELVGIPEGRRDAAAATAREKGLDGWAFTLHAPSLYPFLQYSENRELRRRIYMAANTRCTHDNDNNNFELCKRIVNLRLELAQLLGYKTFADYVLKNRMAKNVVNVNNLLENLIDCYLPAAHKEVAAVKAFAASCQGADRVDADDFMPWDFGHFALLQQLRDYNIDAEMLRPYFPLDSVIDGVFGLATRLYGIRFQENKEISVYHPDVKAFDVCDADGSFLAVLYTDFFPRESKQSGAWMTGYREQSEGVRPHVSVTMNFTKPVPATAHNEGKPSLLTLSEVETFLHEFGHALHGIFANTRYAALSGPNVYWDFVELPSQFMENYALEPEFLRSFAHHYRTGEVIPDELIERVRRSRNYNVAYACMRQVSFCLLDLSYYTRSTALDEDIRKYEAEAWKRVQLLPVVDETCMTVEFNHIMSGGYAAGYYSYKWAEVLDADAFEAFRERGMFSREVANDFRHRLLAKGGTVHPAQLYRDFRGRDATIDALLRRDGLRS